jgi:hypothetical protein
MGQAIPRQQPAVVLRSNFNKLRALLAIALVAVAGLTVAVVILANDSDQAESTSAARAIEAVADHDFSPATGRPEWLLPKWTPEEGTSSAREQDLRHLRAGGVIPTRAREAAGDYAHGPLPPAAPTKDYSKNGATGDYSTQPDPQAGGRPDGGPEEGSHLR